MLLGPLFWKIYQVPNGYRSQWGLKEEQTSLNPPEGDMSTGNIPLPLTYLNHGLKLNHRVTAFMTHCQVELMGQPQQEALAALWLKSQT